MTRYRARLAYDGTAYSGYQRQPHVPTVQGTLEEALAIVLKTPTPTVCAGRTDTGVHATGQVIAFDAAWNHDDATLLRAVNAQLPDDIALQTMTQHEGFHPRYDALSRTYCYDVAVLHVRQPLLAQRAWQLHSTLDGELLKAAAQVVIGEHDFAAFGNPPQGTNTVRTVYRSTWHWRPLSEGGIWQYSVEGTAFLHHMVRRLVGVQVAVGCGWLTVADFERLLASRNLANNKHMAPPQGLTLVDVRYPPAVPTQAHSVHDARTETENREYS